MNDEILSQLECQNPQLIRSSENLNLESLNWLDQKKSQLQLLRWKNDELKSSHTDHEQSKIKEVIKEKLENKWYNIDKILEELIDVVENAMVQWPKWDILPDHKTRLSAIKFMMEITWTHEKKEKTININFMKLFYDN